MLVVAQFSRHSAALDWGRQRLERSFGPILLASEVFPFDYTAYYAKAMGTDLRKQLLAFSDLISGHQLPAIKCQTIHMEQELAASGQFPEARPLNLDPGYLGLRKFVLATTKDQIHRVYLHEGIYAEVTLVYHEGKLRPAPWTYADYQQPDVLEFLHCAREQFLARRIM